MKKQISLKKTVYEVAHEYPELIGIMEKAGFKEITNPNMINTVGRFVTIEKGAKLKNVPLDEIKEFLESNGFEVIDD